MQPSPSLNNEFREFQGFWTPVCFSNSLRRAPIRRRVAGTDIVLFRAGDDESRVGALIDRCPHRGAALSRGKVVDGSLQCPFHGWSFTTDGECARIPWNSLSPEARRHRSAIPIAARDIGGMVWVFTSRSRPEAEPYVPESLLTKGFSRTEVDQHWSAHWTRIIENLLDPTHLPFVHPKTVGRSTVEQERRGDILVMHREDRPGGYKVSWSTDKSDSRYEGVSWTAPNLWEHVVPGSKRFLHQMVWAVPSDHDRTRLLFVTQRATSRWSVRRVAFDIFERLALWEDRRVIESQTPRDIRDALSERNAPTDAATLPFRRWYWTMASEDARTAREGPQRNPAEQETAAINGDLFVRQR